MVRGEIEMARHHAATTSRPRILPVRVKFDGPLPYPLNAYLDSIQYAVWKRPDDTPRLLEELLAAMAGAPPTDARSPPPTPVDSRQPAAAVRRAAAGAGRHARRRRSVVSASAHRRDGARPSPGSPGRR